MKHLVSNPEYHYYFTDHLGSVRVVTDAQGNIEQTNNYYPYGGLMASSSSITNPTSQANIAANQPNRYNGKELDRKNGLDWLDYGARHYVGNGFWGQVDPHAENYYDVTSYGYCHNNPINKIDPDGRDDYYTGTGEFIRHEDNETDRIMIKQWKININLFDTNYSISLFRNIKYCDNLSAETYSNIFTDILSKMDEVDTNDLHNGKVSVRIFEQRGNLPESVDQYNDADFSLTLPYASIQKNREDNKQLMTIYIDNQPTRKDIYSTVSNVKNILGVHEYIGHYKQGLRHGIGGLDTLLDLQHKHPTWQTTTPIFKSVFK